MLTKLSRYFLLISSLKWLIISTTMSFYRPCTFSSACRKMLQSHRVNVSILHHISCSNVIPISTMTLFWMLIIWYMQRIKYNNITEYYFAGTNMNSVHFTTSPNMSNHLDGMPTAGYWGKMGLLRYLQFILLQISIYEWMGITCGFVVWAAFCLSLTGSGRSGKWQTTLSQACGWETGMLVERETGRQRLVGF